MVGRLGPQTDAGAVVEPEPGLLRLFCRDLEPFSLPQPLNTLVVDLPASLTKKRGNAAIAVATILPCQFDHIGDETVLVFPASGYMALCRTVLTKHATGSAFGDAKTVTHPINAVASARRA